MTNGSRGTPHILNLIAIAAVGPMALNIFMPSMPGLVEVFATDYGTVQLALTLYLAALATAQLFVGPISDRIGRRPTVLWGLVTCLFGSLMCVAAPNIELLVAGRMVQAVGGCVGIVMSRSIIRDLYGIDKAAAMIGYLTMVMVIAPMSPSIGGLLDRAVGWQGGFWLIAVIVLLLWAISFRRLGETHHGPYDSQGPIDMLIGFGALLRLRRFNINALQISFSSGAFFAFLGGAPYVMIELMDRTAAEYGLFFILPGGCYMLGNLITARRSERWGATRLVLIGTATALVGGGFLVTSHVTGNLFPATLFGGMAVIAVGNGMALPSGTAGAVSADPNRIGTAAGLAGFLQMATGAGTSYLVGAVLADTATPLVVVMATCVMLAFVAALAGRAAER